MVVGLHVAGDALQALLGHVGFSYRSYKKSGGADPEILEGIVLFQHLLMLKRRNKFQLPSRYYDMLELFQRLAKVVQPMALEPDEDDAAPITWFYAAMAKRTDIGRGFAAVMNHPETAV